MESTTQLTTAPRRSEVTYGITQTHDGEQNGLSLEKQVSDRINAWEKAKGVMGKVQGVGQRLLLPAMLAMSNEGIRQEPPSVLPPSPVPVEVAAPVVNTDVQFTTPSETTSSSQHQSENISQLVPTGSEYITPPDPQFVGRENMSYQSEVPTQHVSETTTHLLEPVHTNQAESQIADQPLSKQNIDSEEESVLNFIKTSEIGQNTTNSQGEQPQNNTGQTAENLDKLNKSSDFINPNSAAVQAEQTAAKDSRGLFAKVGGLIGGLIQKH